MPKIGIIGLGKMGLLHAGILNALPKSSVTSIAEKEGLLVKFAKKLLPAVRFYPSAAELLAREELLDAVYVTTPISSHLTIIEDIISSGRKIGVFVEKPLAGNYTDAKRMSDVSNLAGLQTMTGFQKRFSPIFQKAKKLLEAGLIGELTSFSSYSYVSGIFSKGKGWRSKTGQGGALLDLGPHLIDMLLWYFGELTSMEGRTGSLHSSEVDDFATGKLEFAQGLVGSFDISWSVEGYRLPEIGIEIVGSNGKLKITDDYAKLELVSDTVDLRAGTYHFKKPEFDENVDFLIGDPEYCFEDKYFVQCLSCQKSPEPNFAKGAKVNEIIEKISNHSLKTIRKL